MGARVEKALVLVEDRQSSLGIGVTNKQNVKLLGDIAKEVVPKICRSQTAQTPRHQYQNLESSLVTVTLQANTQIRNCV